MKHKIRSCFQSFLIGAQVSNQGNNLCFADGGSGRKELKEKHGTVRARSRKKNKGAHQNALDLSKDSTWNQRVHGTLLRGGR